MTSNYFTIEQSIVLLIRGYQQYLSPYKGYSCAHRARYGGESCSEYAKKVLVDEGWRAGLGRLRARFRACHAASRSLRADRLYNQVHDEYSDDPRGDGMKFAPGDKPARGTGESFRDQVAECCCWGGGEICCEPAANQCCVMHAL
jgi:putative component of membrane protein insertase Oxa1/YidC/SpoIIIJ protein YidD